MTQVREVRLGVKIVTSVVVGIYVCRMNSGTRSEDCHVGCGLVCIHVG